MIRTISYGLVIYVIIILFITSGGKANGQVKVTDGAVLTLDANSLLELESTNKGLLIPRMAINDVNQASPLTAPVPAGMLVYSTGGTVTDGFYYWNGSQWKKFVQATIQVNEGGTGLTTFGGTNTVLYTSAADVLSSVASSTAAGQFLQTTTAGSAPTWKTILDVTNGGTGSSTQNYVDLTTVQTAAGAKTWSNLGTFNLGLTASGAAVNLNASSNFNTNINTGTSTGAVAIGSTTGAASITQRVGTGNFSLDGVGASTYTIAPSTTTGTVAIGGTAQTGAITIGSSTAAQTVNIGTGTGIATVYIATGNVAGNIKIGDNTGTASSSVQIGGSTTINGSINLCIDNSVAGNDTYTATNANITALATGLVVLFNPLTDNTGACTLNLNGFGALNIRNQDGTNPGSGDLQAGGFQFLVYTGTSWILIGRN